MWTGNRIKGIDEGRTAAGRPVRSIRKNNVLPGSGPTDLHFGKNDLVPSNADGDDDFFFHAARASAQFLASLLILKY